MNINHHAELARYRMEKAQSNLMTARQLFQLGRYDDSVSKSYYAILTAMRCLLAIKHVDSHRQDGVITLFNQHFIKTKYFSKEINKIIRNVKSLREEADYGDFVLITKELAEKEISHAEKFLIETEKVFTKLLTNQKPNKK